MKVRDGQKQGGKYKYIVADSGVEHNPEPRTERGKRRRKANHPNGIQPGHPAHPGGQKAAADATPLDD
tara:strand:- start:5996 stop:6199 length:204 start_codon:yes stop_codon:yes gene_type:complete